ncbi:RNA-binding family protein isoform 2 [Hibiscus syriacus]|uniref:RNA-binding family protein isoform 2 n=1 Tax=Hibiscus syriacus TaxID=106335 RepID=A0A6A3AES1_HIBSY|nr:RNA-binding family protein isoform 2 [Hibiscus syriacus]
MLIDPRGGEPLPDAETNHFRSSDYPEDNKSTPYIGDGASPGKIFIGGLARETSSEQPRGFGFVTYVEPSVVDKVIEDTHVINGNQVDIKRTIPKEASGSKDFKTRKIFVDGIPSTVSEDEFKDYFIQYGEVREHEIMRDHATNRSRGFGFITFKTEQAVDDLLEKGNKIDFTGAQVEIKREIKLYIRQPQFMNEIKI